MTSVVPLDLLLGGPDRAFPEISPDGQLLSFIAPVDGSPNVWVGGLSAEDARPITQEIGRGIGGDDIFGDHPCIWTAGSRHLLYLNDEDGDENAHIYRLDTATGEVRDLTPFHDVQAQLLATSNRHPNHAVIALNKDDPYRHDAYRVTLSTGELEKIAANPGGVVSFPELGGWVVDRDLQVRAAMSQGDDGTIQILARGGPDGAFDVVLEMGLDETWTTQPLCFTADGGGMYLITALDANTRRLVEFSLAQRRIVRVLAEDQRYDVAGKYWPVLFDPRTGQPQLVPVLKERLDYTILDPLVAQDIELIRRLDPGDFSILSRDSSDRTWVLSFIHADGPATYFLYDRRSKTATSLFESQPELRDHALGGMEPFRYRARDGLMIEGYLTFPPHGGRAQLPTVVRPHAGPWGRDYWRFDAEVQFLATRGYLVVQPNFRGSTGYGKVHLNAGDREWGGKMQDDIVDALEYVVGQGFADRNRAAIMGGSFGGYAALVGAAFTPNVFRCAVSFFGPSNLVSLLNGFPSWLDAARPMLHRRVGDPGTERDFLWSRSPLSRANDIRIPLFVAQGANDVRVDQGESDAIVSTLKARGIPVEYVVFSDEGHGFARPQNRIAVYKRVEGFLADHLGGLRSH